MDRVFFASVFLYIDPGSGSYIAQVVIAGILGILYYFKAVKHFFVSLVRKIMGKDKVQP